MPFPHRLVSFLLVTATALGPVAHAGTPAADPGAEVDTIRDLAQDAPRAALDRVQAARRDLGPNAPYDARQMLLRTEVALREDLGQQDSAYTLERESLQLAQARGDKAGVALAMLGQVRELLDAHRLDDAQALLDRIVAQAPKDTALTFNLGGDYTQFKATVGIDENGANATSAAKLTVEGDGQVLFTGTLIRKDKPKGLVLPVKGVKQLKLIVEADTPFNGNYVTLADAGVQK